ncbi:MAG: hypothetical protein ACYDA1_09250 [Vulcanimicrobiaceae bacterium]
MKHVLRTTRVEAPFSTAISHVAEFFEAHPSLQVESLAYARVPITAEARVIDDATDSARRHEAVLLFLRPKSQFIPHFRGAITVRPYMSGAVLRIEGSYEPPGGVPGRMFDWLLGRWLAILTLDHLLFTVKHFVERRHREFVRSCPSIDEINTKAVG